MLLLTSVSDIVRVVTSVATTTIEVHASYVDLSGTTVTPARTNTRITTATTTTIVASPAASTQRNVKALYITNNSTGTTCDVAVEHFDGTNSVENGAEYPPSGLGAYNGRSIGFMKAGSAADTVGYWYCTSKDAGFPSAWSVGTSGVNGRVTDGTAVADNGCVPIINPTTGFNYLTELVLNSSIAHSHLFFDCLWVNNGLVVTTTTAQTFTTPTLPARDINGTTNGEGCMIAMLTTTANTNAAAIANTTVSYTNSAGTAGRTATLTAIAGSQVPISPVIGTIVWFNLQAGDVGVQSIQSVTLGTSRVAGAISMMICRDIATIGTTLANIPATRSFAGSGVRLYNGSCILHCYQASNVTATFTSGELTVMER